jgi:hypothetical protein
MKHMNLAKTIVLGLSAATLLMATACSQPAERAAKLDKSIDGKVLEMKEVSEVVGSKSVYVSGGNKQSLTDLDSSIKQVKIEGSKVEELLKKVTGAKTKAALDEQLKNGGVALVVLGDQIKILKVTNDLDLALDYDVLSSKYLGKLKDLSKAADVQQQSALAREVRDLMYVAPRKLDEKFGMVEITALKIEQMGVLDNDRTEYNEKKAILKVQARPLSTATHMVVGGEVGAADESAEKKVE